MTSAITEPGLLNEPGIVANRAKAYLLVRLAMDVVAVALVVIYATSSSSPPAGALPTLLVLLVDLAGLLAYWLGVRRWPGVSTYLQLVFAGILVIALDYSLGTVTVLPWLAFIPLGLSGGLIIARPGFNSLVVISLLTLFALFVGSLSIGRNPLPLELSEQQTFLLAIAIALVLIILNVLVETLVIHLFQAEDRLVQTQVHLFQAQSELEQSRYRLYDVQQATRRIERLSAIGQIAGQITKSLRAPLVAADRTLSTTLKAGPSATAKAGPAPSEIPTDALPQTQTAIQSVLRMLDGLDQFASLGQMQIQNVNLDDLLITVMAGLTVPEGVAVHREKPPILSPIQADPDHIRLMMHHLLLNALQAVGDIGVITVILAPALEGVQFAVSDTGPGIPSDRLEVIFEPLYTTKPHGFGLGLAICQQVVRMQGGRIQVQSAVGQGTTITVYLPRLPRNPPEELAQDMAG